MQYSELRIYQLVLFDGLLYQIKAFNYLKGMYHG